MRRYLVGLLLGALLMSSCTIVRYRSPSLASVPASTTVKLHSMRFLWGWIPPRPVSLEQCGSGGIQKMKVKQGLVDILVTVLTAGIVEPVKIKITCAQPQESQPAVNVQVQSQPTTQAQPQPQPTTQSQPQTSSTQTQ